MSYVLRTAQLLTPRQADAFAVEWRRVYELAVIPPTLEVAGATVDVIKCPDGVAVIACPCIARAARPDVDDVVTIGTHARSWRCALQHCDCCHLDARDSSSPKRIMCLGCGGYLCPNCSASCTHEGPSARHQHLVAATTR